MAMLRHRAATASTVDGRLLLSAPSLENVLYREDYGWTRPNSRPRIYVCGPSAFVERAANLLVALGQAPAAIRTERFGPTG